VAAGGQTHCGAVNSSIPGWRSASWRLASRTHNARRQAAWDKRVSIPPRAWHYAVPVLQRRRITKRSEPQQRLTTRDFRWQTYTCHGSTPLPTEPALVTATFPPLLATRNPRFTLLY